MILATSRRASRWACTLLGLAAVALLASAPAASACDCQPPMSQQGFRDAADVVFTGSVVGGPEDSGTRGFVTYEIAVQRVEKGAVDEIETVETGQDAGVCGLELVVGEAYRVFALRDGEALRTGSCSGTGPAQQPAIERVAGDDRVATAVAVSAYRRDLECSDGDCPPRFGATAVLARSDDYADGLAGTPLAGGWHGPLLLTGRDGLAAGVAEELRRLETQDVVLLGGPAVLSEEVERGVEELGIRVRRIAGSDRYATAAAAALDSGLPDDVAFVALGSDTGQSAGWPDALAAGAVAGREGASLLLTQATRLPDSTREALQRLGVTQVVLVGGTAAVSAQVEDELRAVVGEVARVGGRDRYETARLLADRAVNPTQVSVVTGNDWPDSLGAGAAVVSNGGVLLPVDGRDPVGSPSTRDWLREHADRVERLTLVGGPATISSEVEESIAADVRGPS